MGGWGGGGIKSPRNRRNGAPVAPKSPLLYLYFESIFFLACMSHGVRLWLCFALWSSCIVFHTQAVGTNWKMKSWEPHNHYKVNYHKFYGTLREVFSNVAVNKTVFATLTNEGYLDFVNNSLLHFHRAVPFALLMVVCYDTPSFEWCQGQKGAYCVKGSTFGYYCDTIPQAKGYAEYYSQAFRMVQICRFAVLSYLLKMQYSIFWLDTDAVLLRNPLPIVVPHQADWYGACHPKEQQLMGAMKSEVNRNIGVMYIRRTVRTRLAVKLALFRMYYSAEGRRAHDQYLFNDMFADNNVPTYCMPHEEDGLSCNEEYWGAHYPSPSIWNIHAACAPKGDNEMKANKKKWLIQDVARLAR